MSTNSSSIYAFVVVVVVVVVVFHSFTRRVLFFLVFKQLSQISRVQSLGICTLFLTCVLSLTLLFIQIFQLSLCS